MRTIAILAPPIDGLTPDKFERAQNAMLQQMMLLARGLPVTHPAVRAAAEIVGSAIAADPLEFAIAGSGRGPGAAAPDRPVPSQAPAAHRAATSLPPGSVALPPSTTSDGTASPPPVERAAAPRRDEAYARYLATIYATQPTSSRHSGERPLQPDR